MISFWQLEIQNRLTVGPAFGFSIYLRDEEYDEGEWIFYFGLISVHVKYWLFATNKKNDMKMIDLKTQDGRLINNMPTQETGIAKVSRMAAARNATKLSAARNTARAARMDMMMDMMEQMEIRKWCFVFDWLVG